MRKTKNNYVPAEYGGYMFPKSCFPDILPGDAGKVLTVNQNETEAIWARARGGLVVYVNNPTYSGRELTGGTLDHTWNQINNALRNGIPVQIVVFGDGVLSPPNTNYMTVLHVLWVYGPYPDVYGVICNTSDSEYTFAIDNPNGYPTLSYTPG